MHSRTKTLKKELWSILRKMNQLCAVIFTIKNKMGSKNEKMGSRTEG